MLATCRARETTSSENDNSLALAPGPCDDSHKRLQAGQRVGMIDFRSSGPVSVGVMRRVECIEAPYSPPMEIRYDRIGIVYGQHRHGDPRIMRQVEHALGQADSVVDIGAGTGAYSPGGRQVVAVETSEAMIAQRPDDAAPVVRAFADALPFRDRSFDAAPQPSRCTTGATQRPGCTK